MLPENKISNKYVDFLSKDVIFEPFHLHRMRSLKSLLMIKNIVKTIKQYKPDVLHIQGHGHLWFFLGFPFLKTIPIVNTVHDPKPHLGDKWKKGHRITSFFGLRNSDQFIVHGNNVKEEIVNFYNIDHKKIHVVPLGGMSTIRNSTQKKYPEIPKSILFFGRIWKYKGLDYLILAEPLISNKIKDIKIIIAGRGENIEKYKKKITNNDRFIFKNYRIPDHEVSKLFQQASVVVLPYLEATQSALIPLAYIFSKPVVATNVGGIPDVLEHENQGLLVPPKNEKLLANAIITLLSNDTHRRRMGNNGFKYYNNRLSPEKISESTIKIYKKAIYKK